MSNGGGNPPPRGDEADPDDEEGLPSFDTASDRFTPDTRSGATSARSPPRASLRRRWRAWTVACAVTAQFSNDRMDDLAQRFASYKQRAERWNLHA
ncbi:hypothetical protein MASR2M79_08670 [Aminivibrio sp.]